MNSLSCYRGHCLALGAYNARCLHLIKGFIKGEKDILKLNTHNLASFEKDVDLEEPFPDTLNFNQWTSMEYKCSKQDWSWEALLMEQIYAGTYCNILQQQV